MLNDNMMYFLLYPKTRNYFRITHLSIPVMKSNSYTHFLRKILHASKKICLPCLPPSKPGDKKREGQAPLLKSKFVDIPVADYLADRADGDEGLRVIFADVLHQERVFVFGQDGDNLHLRLVVVAALGLIQGHAAADVVHDVVRQLLVLLGEDADPLALGKAADKLVQNDAVKVCTQKSDHQRLGVVDKERERNGDRPDEGDALAQLDVQVLVEHLTQDVQAAGRGVGIKHHRLADTDNQNAAERVQRHISCERGVVREQHLKDVQKDRHQNGGIDRLGAKLPADKNKPNHQADHVEDEGHHRHLHRNEVDQNHRQTGDAAEDDVARNHKEIDRERRQKDADGDHDIFLQDCLFVTDCFHCFFICLFHRKFLLLGKILPQNLIFHSSLLCLTHCRERSAWTTPKNFAISGR